MIGHSGLCDFERGGEIKCVSCRVREPLTADTITDEQCDEVWRLGCDEGVHGNPDTMHMATVAVNQHGDFTVAEQRNARARCAEILNERAKAVRS